MNDVDLWNKFCLEKNISINTPYEAWPFGGNPDKLAKLVLDGVKTATASLYDLYFVDKESEPLPKIGDYSVILNSKNEAVCIIQTTCLNIVPFDEVSAEHAYKEGEGDRSLAYWQKVHKEFFEDEIKNYNLIFTSKSKILCEEFVLLYKI